MSFKKSKESKTNNLKWKKFKREQASLIENSGIPLDYMKNEEKWIDFLSHGYIDHHLDEIGLLLAN